MRLLLNEHVAVAVAVALTRLGMEAVSLPAYAAGAYLGRSDEALLDAAARDGLVLVTYDQRTIPPLLKQWAEAGRSHGGVIFVDERTVTPSDVGGLIRGLAALHQSLGDREWRNRVAYLHSQAPTGGTA